jgi:hypothetical protein
MKFGVAMFATDYAIRPDDLARACEGRGFESVVSMDPTCSSGRRCTCQSQYNTCSLFS